MREGALTGKLLGAYFILTAQTRLQLSNIPILTDVFTVY